jgi:hypothetical protein
VGHYKIIYIGGELVQSKTIYAKNIIEACTRFIACYHYKIIDAYPVEGPEPAELVQVA